MPEIDPHKYPGPLEELEKQQNQGGSDKSKKIAIAAALGLLVVGGLVMFLLASGEKIDIEELVEEGGIFSVVPFWFIIFIPFIFKKKKKTTNENNQVKITISIIAAITVAITAAIIILINN